MSTNKSIIDPSLLVNYIQLVADEDDVEITINHIHTYLYIIQLCYIRLTHNQLFTNEFHTSPVGPVLDNLVISNDFNSQLVKSIINGLSTTEKEFITDAVQSLVNNYNSSTSRTTSDYHQLIEGIINNEYSPLKMKFAGDTPISITHDDLINYALADYPHKSELLNHDEQFDNLINNKHNVDSFLKLPKYSDSKESVDLV